MIATTTLINSDGQFIPNATDITNKSLNSFPNVKNFFEILVKDTDIEIKDVAKPFQYHREIIKNRYYSNYGIFMDYFVRKHLSNQFNIKITDHRTEHILKDPDNYIIGTKPDLQNAIIRHYWLFRDSENKAMDILKSIKVVSLSHTIYFDEPLPKTELYADEENLLEIIKYFQTLPYTTVDLNPSLDCKYFNGDGDLIFDNEVIYEIKTSKFKSLSRDHDTIPLSKFYQLIIYGFAFYKKTGKIIKKYKIYNTLLSCEYSMELNDIDMDLFEDALKKDIESYDARYKKLYVAKKLSDGVYAIIKRKLKN